MLYQRAKLGKIQTYSNVLQMHKAIQPTPCDLPYAPYNQPPCDFPYAPEPQAPLPPMHPDHTSFQSFHGQRMFFSSIIQTE